jgi:N-acetylmuramoyl-L-alanine amidase-like protein
MTWYMRIGTDRAMGRIIGSEMARQIEFITVHHTATEATGPTGAHIEALRRDHRERRGWVDIAYHLLLDNAGTVWEGRPWALPPDSATDHDFSGHLFVALIGDFEQRHPTPQQLRALPLLVGVLLDLHGLGRESIGSHRDYVTTLCPGRHLQPHVEALRRG